MPIQERDGSPPSVSHSPSLMTMVLSPDEVAAEEVENREENSVGDEASCSLPKVYLYTLWSTCVYNPLRGD